ncbi:MAG: amidohydrolase [Coriobacteriales bacterium]|jgi:predicted TIM-barrel fold metal-dependent hydrolase|nr:amidohydrolase [Coriobacteriales bacterium]
MSKIIDINIHHIPEDFFTNEKIRDGFLSTAPRSYGWVAEVFEMENGKKQMNLEYPKGYSNLNYVEGDYSAASKLAAMDDAGVDYGIMRVPVWQEWLRVETCKEVNDNAYKIVQESEGRLFSTACIPPWNFKENIYELERCVKELGAVGVQLACHYGQLYLDDEAFDPLLKVISDLDVPVVVHHTPLPPYPQSILDYTNLRRELGRITDQATAVGRELFSGIFDKYPNLKFIHTMFGGNWFANAEIMTPHVSPKKEAMQRLSTTGAKEIEAYLKNNIFFDMTHPHSWGKAQVECAVKVCGADHLLFGSSWPVFYGWMSQGIECVKSLDVTEEERALMFYNNAKSMFNLPL